MSIPSDTTAAAAIPEIMPPHPRGASLRQARFGALRAGSRKHVDDRPSTPRHPRKAANRHFPESTP
jgi:hypothetical protein